MHLSKRISGFFFLSTSTIVIALEGHSLLHIPQPIQREQSKIGCPRKSWGKVGFTKGYFVVAGLETSSWVALFNNLGTRGLLGNWG